MHLEREWLESVPGLGRAKYWDGRLDTTSGRSVMARSSGEERIHTSTREGVAVRALVDGAWGFATAEVAQRKAVAEAGTEALRLGGALSRHVRDGARVDKGPTTTGAFELAAQHDPLAADPAELLAGLRDLLRLVPGAIEASVRMGARRETKHIVGAQGADVRTVVTRVSCSIDLTDKATGVSLGRRLGGTGGLELVTYPAMEEATTDALGKLKLLVEAKALAREHLPVVVDPELTGVFAHEAVGHGCEADLVLAGESVFGDLMGQCVGSEEVTIVDDPGRAPGYGMLSVDDEGTLARPRPLIERGVVRGFIHSLETAAELGHEPNGGGRAEDAGSEPIPRMSNTMFLGGSYREDELWEAAGRCIYVRGTRGGQVDTARGTFQFTPQEAYLVVDGEILHAVSGAGLSGNVMRALRSVEAATRVERLGGPGMCGKGQWVPVGDGGPHILVRDVEVGG